MMPGSLPPIWMDAARALCNHLWQSTVFLGIVALFALLLRKNQARTRYWLWMAASAKFLVPFSLLISLGSHLPWPSHAVAAKAGTTIAMAAMSQPFSDASQFDAPVIATALPAASHSAIALLPAAFLAIWLIGVVAMTIFWLAQWRRVSRTVRSAQPLLQGREVEFLRSLERTAGLPRPIRLLLSSSSMEPGVCGMGILRPAILLWPEGISVHLDDAHLESVLAHEVCHVQRRDNLTSGIHMLVEAVFWFHPLVWWMERQLVKERERACDEAVLLVCARPQAYAESILKVCEFCVESPLACVSGITGADLKQRVVEIMTGRVVHKLTLPKKLLLLAVALLVVAAPIMLGQAKAAQRMMLAAIQSAPRPFRAAARAMIPEIETPSTGELAQSQTPSAGGDAAAATDDSLGPAFEVATIRTANRDDGRHWFGGRLDASGRYTVSAMPLSGLVWAGYGPTRGKENVAIDRGAPGWIKSDDFDINAKVDDAYMAGWDKLSDAQRMDLARPMIRRLLADRFHLKLRVEMRDTPVYALLQAKGGAHVKEVAAPDAVEGDPFDARARWMRDNPDKPVPGGIMCSGNTCTGHAARIGDSIGQIQGSSHADRMVIDETGLTGYYDFSFTQPRPNDDSAMTEVLDDLGMKFEPRTIPIKTYVIESAEKPSIDGAELPGQASAMPVSLAQEKTAADAPATALEYSVVSIRQSQNNGGMALRLSPDGYSAKNVTLWGLMFNAYNLRPGDPLPSLPGWATTEQFDLEAKMDSATMAATQALSPKDREAQLDLMLQTILKQRFGLQVHHETKERPIYELVVAKDASKLTRLPDDAPPRGTSWGKDRITVQAGSIAQFVFCLSDTVGRDVVDKTGLPGKYNISLKFAPDDSQGGAGEGPSIFTALQEQLGLKLVASKGPVETLVADHVEKPSEN